MPKRSDPYKTVREHFARGENQEIIDLAERATPLPAGVAYYVAAALINLGGCLRDAVALYRGPLMPAPGVVELRNGLEVTLEATVLAADDTKVLWELAQQMPFNLALWEALEVRLSPDDPRAGVVAGRSARIRTEFGV